MKRKIYDDQLIIITGASGMIGTNVLRHLNDRGYHNFILVDDFHFSPKWKNLIGTRYVDFVSKHELFDWLEGRENDIEAIIHLGACSETTQLDGDYLVANNVKFSQKLADFALHHDIRFIYASSAATYGKGEQGFSDEHALLDTLRPLNLYGYSKHMFDLWLHRQGALESVVGLKYFNIFGPYEYHKGKMASMVFHMYKQIEDTGAVRLFESHNQSRFANGEQLRDFLYVKDAATVTASFLENDACGIFNVGSGSTSSWNMLAKATFKAMKRQEKITYIPMPDTLKKQYQDYTCADMRKYKELHPDFSPTPLEIAVDDYVTGHLISYFTEV